MTKKITTSLFAALVTLLSIGAANAAPATAVGDTKVNSMDVKNGQLKLENFGGYGDGFSRDGTGWRNNTELSYGVNDWLKVGAYTVLDKKVGGKTRYDKTELVSVIRTSTQNEAGVDTGFYLSYDINHLAPNDAVGAIFLVRHTFDSLSVLGNFGLKREVGARSSDNLAGSFDFGVYQKVESMNLRVGAEYFSDISSLENPGKYDSQNHRAGPVVKWKIPGTPVGVELGWLVGLSDSAPDNVIKYQLDYTF
ncbi:MAG: hypothetical protein ACK5XX_05240 [Holosporales bacterium]